VGQVERSLHTKNQLDSSNRFDTIPACDEQAGRWTDTQVDGQTQDDSKYCASITSSGKNHHITAASYQIKLEISTTYEIFPILYNGLRDDPPKLPIPLGDLGRRLTHGS